MSTNKNIKNERSTPVVPTGDAQSSLVLVAPEPELDLESFTAEIWAVYPRKDGKADGMAAIRKAFKLVPPMLLRSKVSEYANAVATWPADQKRFAPMCSTWMNKKRWLDDPSAWVRDVSNQSLTVIQIENRIKELENLLYYQQDRDKNPDKVSELARLKAKREEMIAA